MNLHPLFIVHRLSFIVASQNRERSGEHLRYSSFIVRNLNDLPMFYLAVRSMESTTEPPHAPSRRGLLARIFATLIVIAGTVKAIAFLALDYMRGLAVNPFEGFGATQFAVAGVSMALSIAAYAIKAPLALVVGFAVIILIHEIGHA